MARERQTREQQLNRLVCTDQLTGTLNRRGLLVALEESRNAARNLCASSALLTIDIDGFKSINDSLGHPVGDLVLTQACRRISHSVRRHDVVGRAGGDEIWVVMNGVNKHANVAAMGNNLLRRFAAPIRAKTDVSVTVSIGMALTPDHAIAIDDWIDCSDIALYAAKRNGRNRCVMYNHGLRPSDSAAACDCG
jgi:diguanylate cyclase (GGDEF)-like protein